MSKFKKLKSLITGSQKVELPAPAEAPKLKTVAELTQEYNQACLRIGNLVYLQSQQDKELKMLLSAVETINQDGAVAKQRELAEALAQAKAIKEANDAKAAEAPQDEASDVASS